MVIVEDLLNHVCLSLKLLLKNSPYFFCPIYAWSGFFLKPNMLGLVLAFQKSTFTFVYLSLEKFILLCRPCIVFSTDSLQFTNPNTQFMFSSLSIPSAFNFLGVSKYLLLHFVGFFRYSWWSEANCWPICTHVLLSRISIDYHIHSEQMCFSRILDSSIFRGCSLELAVCSPSSINCRWRTKILNSNNSYLSIFWVHKIPVGYLFNAISLVFISIKPICCSFLICAHVSDFIGYFRSNKTNNEQNMWFQYYF